MSHVSCGPLLEKRLPMFKPNKKLRDTTFHWSRFYIFIKKNVLYLFLLFFWGGGDNKSEQFSFCQKLENLKNLFSIKFDYVNNALFYRENLFYVFRYPLFEMIMCLKCWMLILKKELHRLELHNLIAKATVFCFLTDEGILISSIYLP